MFTLQIHLAPNGDDIFAMNNNLHNVFNDEENVIMQVISLP